VREAPSSRSGAGPVGSGAVASQRAHAGGPRAGSPARPRAAADGEDGSSGGRGGAGPGGGRGRPERRDPQAPARDARPGSRERPPGETRPAREPRPEAPAPTPTRSAPTPARSAPTPTRSATAGTAATARTPATARTSATAKTPAPAKSAKAAPAARTAAARGAPTPRGAAPGRAGAAPPGGANPPGGSARRATNLRDAMAPAVRRPGVRPATGARDGHAATTARPGDDEAGRAPRRRGPAGRLGPGKAIPGRSAAGKSAAGRSGAAVPGAGRPGQRRALLRPVPDLDATGTALAKLPLLERPLASYYLLGSSAGLLLLLGLVMVLSASNVRSFEAFGSSYTIFVRQATWMGIGLPVLLAASRMPVRLFRRVAYPLMAVSLLLLLAVLSPLGVTSNGAQRWVGVGSLTLQPSELAKLALVLWSADLLTRKRRLLGDWKHLIIPIVPMAVLIGGLIMLQPDMGTTIVVFSVLFVVLWVVGTPGRVYGGLLGVIALIGTILAVIEPYRLERLLSYRDPFDNATGSGWQAVHGIYALSSGGWWGEGLGASREKWPDLLPASYTDFILAIIGEELGLLGCLLVVLLFGVFGYAGLRVAHRTDNHFVRLAAAGSTGWILTQAVVNMGAVVGLLPITGIPLPLVSFGGSSLVPTMLSIGMLLAFARSEPAAARLLAERARERREARRARQGRRGPAGAPAPARADRATANRPAGERRRRERPGRERPDLERPAQERPDRDRPAQERPARARPARQRPARERPDRQRPGGERVDQYRSAGNRAGRVGPDRDRSGGEAAAPERRAPGRSDADPGGGRVRRPRPATGGVRSDGVAGGPPPRPSGAAARRAPRADPDDGGTPGAGSPGGTRRRPAAEPGPYRRTRRDPDGPPTAG